jgi:predicted dehydrogenase
VRGILVEKPMCVDIAEADAMVAAAESAGALLVVGHQHRFNPWVEAARRMIQSGQLGTPKRVQVCCQTALLNNGTHAIDAVLYVLGDPEVESVRGQAVVIGNVTERGLPAENSSLAEIRLAGGITIVLQTGDLARERFSALLMGGEGQLKLQFDRLEVLRRCSATWRVEAVPFADEHERLIEVLVTSVQKPRLTCVSDGRKGRRVQELLIAVLASAATEQAVAVPLVDRSWCYSELLERLRSSCAVE